MSKWLSPLLAYPYFTKWIIDLRYIVHVIRSPLVLNGNKPKTLDKNWLKSAMDFYVLVSVDPVHIWDTQKFLTNTTS
jgi:hypothetical protein